MSEERIGKIPNVAVPDWGPFDAASNTVIGSLFTNFDELLNFFQKAFYAPSGGAFLEACKGSPYSIEHLKEFYIATKIKPKKSKEISNG